MEDVDELLDSISGELQRLQEHPELFPNSCVEQDFWHRLEKALGSITHVCADIREHHRRNAALVLKCDKSLRAELMPGRDVSRTSWEQYLHNRAPGVNVDLSDMGSDGSIQILPMSALRLLHGMKEANESIIRGIEAVCLSHEHMTRSDIADTKINIVRRVVNVVLTYHTKAVV